MTVPQATSSRRDRAYDEPTAKRPGTPDDPGRRRRWNRRRPRSRTRSTSCVTHRAHGSTADKITATRTCMRSPRSATCKSASTRPKRCSSAPGASVDAAIAEPDEDSVAAASIAVAEAKALTTEIAILATNRLFELAGTRSTLGVYNLDRHWRNSRTPTLHDPVRWKYSCRRQLLPEPGQAAGVRSQSSVMEKPETRGPRGYGLLNCRRGPPVPEYDSARRRRPCTSGRST